MRIHAYIHMPCDFDFLFWKILIFLEKCLLIESLLKLYKSIRWLLSYFLLLSLRQAPWIDSLILKSNYLPTSFSTSVTCSFSFWANLKISLTGSYQISPVHYLFLPVYFQLFPLVYSLIVQLSDLTHWFQHLHHLLFKIFLQFIGPVVSFVMQILICIIKVNFNSHLFTS